MHTRHKAFRMHLLRCSIASEDSPASLAQPISGRQRCTEARFRPSFSSGEGVVTAAA